MQLHPADHKEWTVSDIKEILKRNIIGCSGDPVQQFCKIKKEDLVLVRHGGTVIGLVRVKENPKGIDPDLKDDYIWFDYFAAVDVLDIYDDKTIYGEGWYLPKTLMPVENEIAYSYIDNLYKDYVTTMKEGNMNELMGLLEYKRQIILQGPPGTGKTRLAKEIATRISNGTIKKTPMDLFKDYIASYVREDHWVSELKHYAEMRDNFYRAFPKESLSSITKEEYSIGTGDNNSFCWWIERGLQKLGKYFPGNSSNYHMYFSKEKQDYISSRKLDNFGGFQAIPIALSELVNDRKTERASLLFGSGFILKILNSYYPDEYFPVNGEEAINNIIKVFNIPSSDTNPIEKNKMINEFFKNIIDNADVDITTYEIMHYLFGRLGVGGDVLLIEEQEIKFKNETTIIQFHPSYTYEDFVRGISAKSSEGNIEYIVENKTLGLLIEKALLNPLSKFVLIIDEINRANLSSVLGELIYALEYRYRPEDSEENKRIQIVQSIYGLVDGSKEVNYDLCLPQNLYIIGTMNTADRSVGHIDYAIRRRFAFVDILPKNLKRDGEIRFDEGLFEQVSKLFIKDYQKDKDYSLLTHKIEPSKYISNDFRPEDVWLGHSYFMDKSKEKGSMDIRLKYEIKPILLEYIKDGILKEDALTEIEKLTASV
ncbi:MULTISPECIES: AAA family ATPase [Sphingobacterium]|uniref:AAA family ATPase n=1 Tax=Sphingobacterium TaxID=28453 RepID=UPI00190F5E6C|nr:MULTISPECIES: AAA family ATPase [Sphingobacterium]